jgi:hypothetical protein
VNSHTLYFVGLIIFLASMSGALVYSLLRARQLAEDSWETLFHRLNEVDRYNIERIALDLLDEPDSIGHTDPGIPGQLLERGAETSLEPSRIYAMIGGMEGLEALDANCDVLIDMAAYVQRWYPEAVVVAEQLRLNAREIKWHLSRIQGASETGNLDTAFPDYAQRAVATYYKMTRSLLDLYARGDLPELAQLQSAI